MAKTFQCTVVTPSEQLLDEPVVYANLPAHDGQMGVLQNRAAMLVELGEGELLLRDEKGAEKHYTLRGGFAQMKDNRLTLLTEEASATANTSERGS